MIKSSWQERGVPAGVLLSPREKKEGGEREGGRGEEEEEEEGKKSNVSARDAPLPPPSTSSVRFIGNFLDPLCPGGERWECATSSHVYIYIYIPTRMNNENP